MGDRRSKAIVRTRTLGIFDVRCTAPESRRGEEEHVTATQLVVPRSGVFGVTRERDEVIAEPNVAIFLEAGSTYSVDHPSSRGDRCTVFVFDPQVLEVATAQGRPSFTRLSPTAQLVVHAISRGHDYFDDLDFEEAGVGLLASISGQDQSRWGASRQGEARRRRVNEVCSLLASRPEAPWRLAAIADAVHVSPFHLARQFREVTGTTLGHYILRLRLSVALERIAGGEASLARVAADAGFAHHSHLSERFRLVFGITPSEARATLTTSRLRRLTTRLKALRV